MKRTIALAAAILQFSSVLAAQSENDAKTLRGLTGVSVVIGSIDSDVEREGLFEKDIRNDAELQLKEGGIKVLSEKESRSTPGRPQLRISIYTMKTSEALYVYSLEIDLLQRVTLERDPKIAAPATTWNTGSIGIVGAAKVGAVREKIKDRIDEFIEAWQTENTQK